MWFRGGSSAEGTRMEAPTGVGHGEGGREKNFCIFSFEMVHFDAFWRTFRPTVIVTVMFMTSAEV